MGLAKTIYNHSPVWMQLWALDVAGAQLRRVRYGSEFQKRFPEFMRRQWDSATALRDYQNERLQAIVAHAYEHVPYYREVMSERRLVPDDIRTVADLPKLPLLERDVLKNQTERLLSRHMPRRRMIPGETSGTTGSPLITFWDHSMVVTNAAVEWRQKAVARVKFGDRVAVISAGRSVVPLRQSRPPYWRFCRPLNQLMLSAFHLSETNLPAYVEALRAFRPAALEAYPSTAHTVARYLLDRGIELPVGCVFTTSEALLPGVRKLIERAFNTRVYDYYGMAERIIFATECEQPMARHINLDYGITEVVDASGNILPDGRQGRLVGTSLHNLAMPLIRCVTSDVASVSGAPCPCGRNFPLMGELVGRVDDCLVLPDGRVLPPSGLGLVTDPLYELTESQLIQEDARHLVVKIVRGPRYTDGATRQFLANLRQIIGDQLEIEVQFVEHIPKTVAGKHRWLISRVKPPQREGDDS